MLRRICIPLLSVLLLLPAAFAAAAKDDNESFCRGYIMIALGALPLKGLDRNDMWLAWNETVQTTIIEGQLDEPSYQSGRETFSKQLAANNVEGMIDITNGRCELGKNPTWVWW